MLERRRPTHSLTNILHLASNIFLRRLLMLRNASALCSLALLVMLAPTVVRGQAVYGNIVGTVTDQQSAAVADAKVTITDTQRQVNFSTTTNNDGNFTQRFLIAGSYQIRIEAAG